MSLFRSKSDVANCEMRKKVSKDVEKKNRITLHIFNNSHHILQTKKFKTLKEPNDENNSVLNTYSQGHLSNSAEELGANTSNLTLIDSDYFIYFDEIV